MQTENNPNPRTMGIIIFVIGLALALRQIALPIHQALRGAPGVWYSTELVGLAPMAVLSGPIIAISGPKSSSWLNRPPSTGLLIAVVLVAILVPMGSIMGLEAIMKSLGYS